MDERPEALLKSALEKIVYFEARSEQLHNDLRSAQSETERHKAEVIDLSKREIDLRQQVAELEVRLERALAERADYERLVDAMRRERTELIGKLVEASRIDRSMSADDDAFDLASFISELRQNAQQVQQVQSVHSTVAPAVVSHASVPAVMTPAPVAVASKVSSGITQQAVRLRAEGRLDVSAENILELTAAQFAGRSDESLFGFSIRELSSNDALTRQRAAERLKALGNAAATPALASAIHAETDTSVTVALLAAFSSLASKDSVGVVLPLLQDQSSEVRMAAMKALLHMDTVMAGPHLALAMRDVDPWVRRRASLLALGLSGDDAFRLGEHAIADSDAHVRSLGALVLGASAKPQARALLQQALKDDDKKVRHAAAQSLSRLLGTSVASVVEMDDAQRRREVRRIAAMPERTVRAEPPPQTEMEKAHSKKVNPLEMMLAPVSPVRVQDEQVCQDLMSELRMALRGRSLNELAMRTKLPVNVAQESVSLLVARGQAVVRGSKYFAA